MKLTKEEKEKVQFTNGCPNGCQYCYEKKEIITFDRYSVFHKIQHSKHKEIQILDMNFLANPKHIEILQELPLGKKYELVCGVDYRLLTDVICTQLKQNNFIKPRWAWDYGFSQQKTHQRIWRMFKKAGYKPEELRVFMLVNWKIPYKECVRKLDLLKIWNVQVSDCCFDGGYKRAKPVYWTPEQIKRFRFMCRKHNQMIIHKIDPEYKGGSLKY